jgi:uncharacterized membrane protein
MALRKGFDAFTTRLPLLLGAWLVILAGQQLLDLLIPDSWLLAQSIVPMIVLAPLYAGQYLLALKVVRGEPVVFSELFAGMAQLGPIIGAYLLVTLLTVVGMFALIIPGIIVSLMYAFVSIRFLDPKEGGRRVGVIDAMSESSEITKGYRGTLLGIGLLLAIPYMVLGILWWLSIYSTSVPPWAIDVVAFFSGALFLGPVQATSFMAVYDHALNHRRNLAEPAELSRHEPG